MFPANFFFFFFHWLYGNTVPFFSWRPSWCLPFLRIPSPPFVTDRGCSDALGQNWFALGKEKNNNTLLCKLKICFPWRGLFSCIFTDGRVRSECVQLKTRACRCHPGGTCPSAGRGGRAPGPWLPAAPFPCFQREIFRVFLVKCSRISIFLGNGSAGKFGGV